MKRQMELANGRRKELVKKLVKTLSVGSYKQNKLAKKGGIYWLMKGFSKVGSRVWYNVIRDLPLVVNSSY